MHVGENESAKFVSYKDIKKQMADLKFIYVTSTEETALNKLELFKDNWAPCPLISGIQKP